MFKATLFDSTSLRASTRMR